MNLYHYTDFNAMRGIICKGEIWLWNLRRMNDSQEMAYFVKELNLAVKALVGPELEPRVDALFEENLRDFEHLNSYAACFSEYADDASQWARYAKGGMGVCIAFDKELLSRIGEAGHAPLCQVSYSPCCANMEIAKEFASVIKEGDENDSQRVQTLFNSLINSSPLFKHPSFISEKEYRLVSVPGNASEFLGNAHYFIEETNIKKYYILNLKNVCASLGIPYEDVFCEICIGPQARVTREVLSDYFADSGMSALCSRIKISECPLRRF